MTPPSAIIIGASSGIGRALSKELASLGWGVIAAARRIEMLDSLKNAFPEQIATMEMDVLNLDRTLETMDQFFREANRIDLVVINAGVGEINLPLNLEEDLQMIDTNARSFAALASVSFRQFALQGSGHIAGITSISAERAGPGIAYTASKAFASRYLDGLRLKAFGERKDIAITDIRPGFVDTDMIDKETAFWVAPLDKAAKQIANAIIRKKKVANITKRWRLISWLFKLLPERIYAKLVYSKRS
ncbi:MAG: SDR family NAD(P)-dependent oxidoreductase [Verrucomicrobiota bacterium]